MARFLSHFWLISSLGPDVVNFNYRTFASQGLIKLSQQPVIQKFMYQVDSNCSQSQKEIYQPGNLRLVSNQYWVAAVRSSAP